MILAIVSITAFDQYVSLLTISLPSQLTKIRKILNKHWVTLSFIQTKV